MLKNINFLHCTESCRHTILELSIVHIPPKLKQKLQKFDILTKIINFTSPCILQKISTHSFQGFVFYIKQHLLQTYEDHCSLSNCYVCNRSTLVKKCLSPFYNFSFLYKFFTKITNLTLVFYVFNCRM